jgi:outer membrane translocation and assembly module TamA
LAFFYEEGTVADKASDLWNEKRTSAGIGTRLVTGSGFVYRLDFATGTEGGSTIVIFDYPWGTFGQ